MNTKYQLVSEIIDQSTLNEFFFKRHRFFNPLKQKLKAKRQAALVVQRNKRRQMLSMQKSLTRANQEKAKRQPQGL